MSRGPRISQEVKLLITEKALENRKEPRESVAAKLQEIIGILGYPVPDTETLLRHISRGRNCEMGPEDEPWSLAGTETSGIPPEAVPAVLGVWKWCLARGVPFAIREAKWAVRLLAVVSDTAELSRIANRYATRELACEIEGMPLVTSDLDLALAASPWERETLHSIGRANMCSSVHDSVLGAALPSNRGRVAFAGGSAAEKADLQVEVDSVYDELVDQIRSETADGITRKIAEGVARLPRDMLAGMPGIDDWAKSGIAEEAKWVYAHWLFYIAEGPNWPGLSLEERSDIIRRLREWIENHPWSGGFRIGPRPKLEWVTDMPFFRPSDLLREAGYQE